MRLICPNCEKPIGKIAESEFTAYIKKITCPECKKTYSYEKFSPDYLPIKRAEEALAKEEELRRKQEQEQAIAKEEELRRKQEQEQAIAKEEELRRKQEQEQAIAKEEELRRKQEQEQAASGEALTTTHKPIRSTQLAQIYVSSTIDPNQRFLLRLGRNIIGRKIETGNTPATILIKTDPKINTMSRAHLIIDVNIRKEGTSIKYEYTAMLYKKGVNSTLFNDTKMVFDNKYTLKHNDTILFPDGTKLTFIDAVE